jgi:hypothetical protein
VENLTPLNVLLLVLGFTIQFFLKQDSKVLCHCQFFILNFLDGFIESDVALEYLGDKGLPFEQEDAYILQMTQLIVHIAVLLL